MCELLGMECNVPTDITFSFTGFALRGGKTGPHADGWGLALYDGKYARSFLEATPACESPMAAYIRDNPIKTLLAVAHVRKKTRGRASLENTHPFKRTLWGRHWVFAHNGTLPLVRHYNSLLGLNVGLGYGWTTAYNRRLEPFGIVILEAWRAGTAVVASNRGGAPEFVRDGADGVLIDPFDTEGFAGALEALLADSGRRRAIAEAGRSRVQAFGWPSIAEAYRQVYSSVSTASPGDHGPPPATTADSHQGEWVR